MHNQAHQAISIVFHPVTDAALSGYGCTQCTFRCSTLDQTTLNQHQHNTHIRSIEPQERETMVNMAYQLCQRKNFRKDQPDVMQCARCSNQFPTSSMRMCAGGTCNGVFCEHCFPQASVNHIHGPSNFRCITDEARPEIGFLPDGWRALRNKEGRVYYLQERTKIFTFIKPALPKTLPPGWTSALDPQGKTIYIDPDTRLTTYVNPVFGIAPLGYELKQTETGRLYYRNRKTGATTWHKPLAIEPLPAGWEAGQTADGKMFVISCYSKVQYTNVIIDTTSTT